MRRIKLLLIEDDPYICQLIMLYAENDGYEVVAANDGMEGLQCFYDVNPDLIVLDLMLPEVDGWEICRRIRSEKQTPIIMLTGKAESYDKIKGLELGADDYIVKPFEPKELLARVRAVLRRTNPMLVEQEAIVLPGLVIDPKQHRIKCLGVESVLPRKEMELLVFLVVNAGKVFTRQQLIDEVWGFHYDGDPRTVDVHIKRIREKLGEPNEHWSLKTIWGIGYKFEVSD